MKEIEEIDEMKEIPKFRLRQPLRPQRRLNWNNELLKSLSQSQSQPQPQPQPQLRPRTAEDGVELELELEKEKEPDREHRTKNKEYEKAPKEEEEVHEEEKTFELNENIDVKTPKQMNKQAQLLKMKRVGRAAIF